MSLNELAEFGMYYHTQPHSPMAVAALTDGMTSDRLHGDD